MPVERLPPDGRSKKKRNRGRVLPIREVALAIKRWALNNQMIDGYPARPEVDQTVIRNVFGGVGVPASLFGFNRCLL